MNGTLKTLYEDKNISLEQGEGIYRITFFKDCHWAGDIVLNSEGIIANDLGEKNYFEQACKPRKRDYEIPIIECRLPEEQAKIVEDVSRKMTESIIKQLDKEKKR